MKNLKQLENDLRQYGYKLTGPRLAVLRVLVANHHPLSAQEIYRLIRPKHRADLVSVYRILSLFYKLGLVFEETVRGEKLFYSAKSSHHHILCQDCGKMECVPCRHSPIQIKGFRQIKHQVLLEGVCLRCCN